MHYASNALEFWWHRGDSMQANFSSTVAVANDAVHDPELVVIDPDYNSSSASSIRIIGYSTIAGAVVTVIVLVDGGVV